jgi:hypothetical protein
MLSHRDKMVSHTHKMVSHRELRKTDDILDWYGISYLRELKKINTDDFLNLKWMRSYNCCACKMGTESGSYLIKCEACEREIYQFLSG